MSALDLLSCTEAEEAAEGLAATYDESVNKHTAMVDILFPPPESYDDAHAARLHEIYLYLEAQPCTCTQPAVDLQGACPRCRLLNREFNEYVGHGR